MTEEHLTSAAYIIQEERGGPYLLQVMDHEKGEFHSVRLSVQALARLASECADRVHVALGGTDLKKGNYIHNSLDNGAGVIYITGIDNGGSHD